MAVRKVGWALIVTGMLLGVTALMPILFPTFVHGDQGVKCGTGDLLIGLVGPLCGAVLAFFGAVLLIAPPSVRQNQRAALDRLASGASDEEAAQAAGVWPELVANWRNNDPWFAKELPRRQAAAGSSELVEKRRGELARGDAAGAGEPTHDGHC